MTTALDSELSTYRWSSHDQADRFPVEDPGSPSPEQVVGHAARAGHDLEVELVKQLIG